MVMFRITDTEILSWIKIKLIERKNCGSLCNVNTVAKIGPICGVRILLVGWLWFNVTFSDISAI